MNAGCPLCNTATNTIVYDRLQLPGALVVKCDHCTHIYTLQKNLASTEKLYSTEAYTLVENRRTLFDKILTWEYQRVVNRVTRLKPSKGFLLDFGCGKGKLASIAQKKGWQVKCVETATERALYAKNIYGLEVDTRYYSGGKIFNNDFDVVTLFHVVEHLPEPKALLSEIITHNLKAGALVVIEVPNIKSWQSSIAGNKWVHLDIARHFHHFSAANLEKLTSTLKLRLIKSHSFSFHLGVLGMVDAFLKRSGYKGNIIYELKNRKNRYILFYAGLLLPLAFLLEVFASAIGRGGVLRKYFIRVPEIHNSI
jgi:2-polyprenyl-3-methyl-5-hydroxy-6-metoxy-1,4-benzoquinol methylase